MQDPIFNKDSQVPSPFQIGNEKARAHQGEGNSALFLKAAFDEDPGKGLELLFRRFYKPLCSHAVRFVYSKQVAEDLVSEVFFQFYRTKAYENITSSYTSYLFRSVRNECYTYMSKEFGRTDSIESSVETTLCTTQPQPDAEIHYNNLILKVNDTIGKLPAQCQRVFLLSRFENKKYNEIAQELQISPKTVEVHISKALKHLRLALKGEWMISSLVPFIGSIHILS
jgi:RNA polymerase sigma-70 factor (family 1)